MWKLIHHNYKVSIIVISVVCIFLIYYSVLNQTLIRSISYSITTITIAAFIIGKYLWRYIYFDFFKRNLCPDFNGVWMGYIRTNYDNESKIIIPIKIEADFFKIQIKTNTTIGRSYSNNCQIIRTEDNGFELEYMFKAYNNNQSDSDTSFYEGAVRVRVDDIESMNMSGLYWTNRCWQKGQNTAGTIVFEKTDKPFESLVASKSK